MEFKETAQYMVLVLAVLAGLLPFISMSIPASGMNDSIISSTNFSNRLTNYSSRVTSQLDSMFGANSSLTSVISNAPVGSGSTIDISQLAYAFGAVAAVTFQVAKFMVVLPFLFLDGVIAISLTLMDYINLLPPPFAAVAAVVALISSAGALMVAISIIMSIIEFITGKKV